MTDNTWITIIFLIYMLPAIIAMIRSHINWPAITMATVLIAWTGIGWIACLVWSFTRSESR